MSSRWPQDQRSPYATIDDDWPLDGDNAQPAQRTPDRYQRDWDQSAGGSGDDADYEWFAYLSEGRAAKSEPDDRPEPGSGRRGRQERRRSRGRDEKVRREPRVRRARNGVPEAPPEPQAGGPEPDHGRPAAGQDSTDPRLAEAHPAEQPTTDPGRGRHCRGAANGWPEAAKAGHGRAELPGWAEADQAGPAGAGLPGWPEADQAGHVRPDLPGWPAAGSWPELGLPRARNDTAADLQRQSHPGQYGPAEPEWAGSPGWPETPDSAAGEWAGSPGWPETPEPVADEWAGSPGWREAPSGEWAGVPGWPQLTDADEPEITGWPAVPEEDYRASVPAQARGDDPASSAAQATAIRTRETGPQQLPASEPGASAAPETRPAPQTRPARETRPAPRRRAAPRKQRPAAKGPRTKQVSAKAPSIPAPSPETSPQPQPTAQRPPARARTGRRTRRRLVLWYVALAGVLAVAAGAGVVYMKRSGTVVPHVVATPARLGGYVEEPRLASQMQAATLRKQIIAESGGEVKHVVDAVYQDSTGPASGPQIILFIGGNLTGTSAGAFISTFTGKLPGAVTTGAGSLGGEAACVPSVDGRLAECVWADDDTFGVVASQTLSKPGLAGEMRQLRPMVEHVAASRA